MTIRSSLPSVDGVQSVEGESGHPPLNNLKVSVLRYPTGSVINIKCDTRDMSVRLQAGMSASESLLASAREDRRKAQLLISLAETMEAAAAIS
ncbi:hypothetical protein [Acidovorax sp.]|uniref:hypothetical protein n=1 Tax=Acidovorax sp. TaxID=1872122 RepID=UPI00391EEBB0